MLRVLLTWEQALFLLPRKHLLLLKVLVNLQLLQSQQSAQLHLAGVVVDFSVTQQFKHA
jgi:hypothetical protein